MKAKLIAICIIGLMVFSSASVLGKTLGKDTSLQNDTHRNILPANAPGVLFSSIKVRAQENANTNTGGYSLNYFMISLGRHNVAWNIDYTIWYTNGEHTHGSQNGIPNTLTLGPIQINYGRVKYNWENYNYGTYTAGMFCDGNETNEDEDDDDDYDGDFGVDAGDEYEAAVGETIQFMGTAWGGVEPYTWLWYFGDGNTSTEQNPQYAYTAEGEYEVLLEVTDANGSVATDHTEAEIGEDEEEDEFEAHAGGEYEADINETIQFYGFAEGGVQPYTWMWYFGDGATSTEQNPTHAYTAEGEYEVLLVVTDAINQTAEDDAEAEIGEDDEGEDEFEADAGGDYEADVNETIQFYGSAEDGVEPYTWSWDFGDGATSTEQNPTHAYTAAGEYEVTLTVTDATNQTATAHTEAEIGEDEEEEEDEFEAHAEGQDEAEINETIQFYGTAYGGVEPYTWSWDFGDGTTSTEQNPQHVYMAEGEYEITLTVTDSTGATATDDTDIEIGEDDQ